MPLSCPLTVIAGLKIVELVITCCPWGYNQVTPILMQILQDCIVYYFFLSKNIASIFQANYMDGYVSITVFFTFYCCGLQSETHFSSITREEKTRKSYCLNIANKSEWTDL